MPKATNTIVAHRGAWKALSLPQNSIASLRRAIELGCVGSEFDVRMTADDTLVVAHDEDHEGLDIEASTYAELVARPLPNGEPLPTLRMYLAEGLRQNPSTTLVCEIKPSPSGPERGAVMAEKSVALVREMGAAGRTMYISFGWNICEAIKRLDRGAHVQYLNGEKSPAELKAAGMDGLDYHYPIFRQRPEWIAEAKAAGLALNAWTVNTEADLRWLLGEGFAYVTTDEPELGLELEAGAGRSAVR